MALASGAQHSISYVPEVTFGTTPGTPAMVELPHSGCTLDMSRASLVSENVSPDRMIKGVRLGNYNVKGDISFDFMMNNYDTWLAAALMGTWATDVLKAGAGTPVSFSIERAFNDITQYVVYKGCMIDTFSLDIKPDAIVTGSFGILGAGVNAATGTPLDASVTAAAANQPFASFDGVLQEGGSSIAIVTGLNFTLKNNLRQRFVVGNKSAYGIGSGKSDLTGTLTAWFETAALLNKFINETSSSVQVQLVDGTKSYTILIPSIKYTGGSIPSQGDGDITLSLPFQAQYDGVTGTNMQITRDLT